ncbi:MAG: thiolase domain-containing protein, partial [Phycisphaerae bacterium]|nr:thiolase domain-containing protein [Phycisphaerae bacterium]
IGVGVDRMALHEREDRVSLLATRRAAERAYAVAGVTPQDIDLAEVHDCFTIAELCATEALGFFAPGQGGPAAADGVTAIEGRLPINASGGLLGRGHPFGATGLAQVVLLARQLRREAGVLQVGKARRALAQSLGGSGASSIVTILTAEKQ